MSESINLTLQGVFMKNRMSFVFTALSLMASLSQADICGIAKTAQGRTAANIIDAKVKQSRTGLATLLDSGNMQTYQVRDALISNKNGFELNDGKYFDFKVTMADGTVRVIDIGYTYIVMNDGKLAVSLQDLTGCADFEKPATIELPVGGARAE
jgi:hypothetical protein